DGLAAPAGRCGTPGHEQIRREKDGKEACGCDADDLRVASHTRRYSSLSQTRLWWEHCSSRSDRRIPATLWTDWRFTPAAHDSPTSCSAPAGAQYLERGWHNLCCWCWHALRTAMYC